MGLFPTKFFRFRFNDYNIYIDYVPYGICEWNYNVASKDGHNIRYSEADLVIHDYAQSIVNVLNKHVDDGYAGMSEAELLKRMFNLDVKIEEYDPP